VTSTKTAPASRDVTAELAFLTRALKAPTLRDAVSRLAERARAESWTHEEFLAACLQREVSARESHGGEGRIRAARFPARKALELSGVLQGPSVTSAIVGQDACLARRRVIA
jgi:DNA replication protein DnaC